MIVTLPIEPGDPNQGFSTTLEGETYAFSVKWNERDDAWYMDIVAENGEPIVVGQKIVAGVHIGSWSPHPLFSRGVFVAYVTGERLVDPGFGDLGTNTFVLFYSMADIVAEMFGS